MHLAPDDIFAGCRILSRCGHGTYGTVYLAEDATGRRVALKVFDSSEAGERELHGVRNYIRLPEGAPSLVAIYHAGIEEGHFFYLMEAADNASETSGEYLPDTLALRLARRPRLPLPEALAICQTLLDGLETMHQAGLLHRDIKPENILFVHGQPKLGDPGMAGDFTHTLSVAGTLGFIPPELFNATTKPSPSTDVYALGKVLYCMVTGRAPGDFPSMPPDLDRETMLQICLPLAKLCNPVSAARCQDCQTARRTLDEITQRKHWFLRTWMRAKWDNKYRNNLLITSILVLISIALIAGVLGQTLRQRREAREQARTQALAAAAAFQERMNQFQLHEEALQIQLTALGEDALGLSGRLAAIRELSETGQPQEAERQLDALEAELSEAALRHQPSTAFAEPFGASENFFPTADLFGYLASPLGLWFLPTEVRQELQATAEVMSQALKSSSLQASLQLGKDLHFEQQPEYRMKFVPPGTFHSPTTHQTEQIDYPYWVLETETSFKLFKSYLNSRGRQDGQSTMPATQISWNEMLAFCQSLTTQLQKEIDLPDGYALRLPTEAEWEFAALGGSTARLPEAMPIPPDVTAVAVHSGTPNPFGLLQLDGNLSEVIGTPYPGYEPMEGYTILRGANFQSPKTDIVSRATMRFDQTTLDTIGFRFVLAPTDDGYFNTHWFRANPLHIGQANGKCQASLESCQAVITWDIARQIAEGLRAHLPEPASSDELTAIFSALQADDRFPAALGIVYQDGAWRTISDHHAASLAKDLAAPAETSLRRKLSGQPRFPCTPINGDSVRPNLILEWDSPVDYENRPSFPCEETFDIDGRTFGILPIPTTALLLPGLLTLTRHRAIAPLPPETLQKMLDHLKTRPESIALGAWQAMDGWRWQDNTLVDAPTPPVEFNLLPMSNIYHCILIAHEGQLKFSSNAQAILVELK